MIERSSSFRASEGPKVALRSGISLPVLSQPLKEERFLIQWMLESEGSSRAALAGRKRLAPVVNLGSERKKVGRRAFANYSGVNEKSKLRLFWKNFYKMLDQPSINMCNNDYELRFLQTQIEDLTMNFDENSAFKSSNKLIKMLIGDNFISAKEYLKKKKCGLSKECLTYQNVLGNNNSLGSLFNCLKDLPVVRLSTLIEQLDNTVRVQAGMKIAAKLNKSKVSRKDYAIGVCLVEFLVEQKLIIVKTVNDYTEDVL
ncbi:hypothetical protein G4B88_000658 [Cannabis sativa]|uniref:Uncharacterized protein n=1 Tax=Cannabis sativa TaxID=3483 RepID=A0A7J6HFP7_CANSA|nr:hypothetical protein G4B88_000658 [Cannabis sativa]